MLACEQFRQGDEVAERLAHLLAIDGDHVVVNPVVHALCSARCFVLGDFAFVVREHEVHAASVDVEFASEVFLTHYGALQMPSRKALSPR